MLAGMAIQRMDHVGVVVGDLEAAVAARIRPSVDGSGPAVHTALV
jgi:hypothetical protein